MFENIIVDLAYLVNLVQNMLRLEDLRDPNSK